MAASNFMSRSNRVTGKKRDEFVGEVLTSSWAMAHSQQIDSKYAGVELLFIEHTMLCDKRDMLLHVPEDLGASRAEVKRTFELAERLRNRSVHPSSLPEFTIADVCELRQLIRSIEDLTSRLYAIAAR